ncbi:MAG: site-2 protease family protein [Betaproteobacteria bacterium]|nr:MAG: site-2 protease family protein [Betaproteobacteria bacterium]
MDITLIQKIAIYALPVIFAITVHEAAHGYAALKFGDTTAQQQGRITLNPLKHIDPIGTLLVPALALFLGGILFGWAKPVPVDFRRLRNPRQDMVWVAAAGPGANLLMAVFWVLILKFAISVDLGAYNLPLRMMAEGGILINAVLMVLNLLPLPPLDGGRIAVGLLPDALAMPLARIEPYGFFILIGLMLTGVLSLILNPGIAGVMNLLSILL